MYIITQLILAPIRNLIAHILKLRKFNAIERLGADPLGSAAGRPREFFLQLAQEAARASFPEIDNVEKTYGESIDKCWLDEVAFHTQVVVKDAELNYQHGRLLYSVFSYYLKNRGSSNGCVYVFETGTARGFSAVCMSKALRDKNVQGVITTVDILPHDVPMFWNCVDDLDGRKSRREILNPWEEYLSSVIFVQQETLSAVSSLAFPRINFAFLDASHTFEDVLAEFSFVQKHQKKGDMIVFDDVTPAHFPGVVSAVEEISRQANYKVDLIEAGQDRGYAIATRLME